ncbi:uncharacterized protein N0V89_002280 [Didymosphaeria variabile]|uniref:Uncharacterized protein n=1 Tax=Didymosphaeria variabile TaxID=1932322 RepID=A0A9W8XSG7_9PLEO|nr:uncharacterized protein N0V89_002280 [Didymosphaeria variabile]KAJ4357704.1 hypothetical protein N0V89_002280 [Didymosphaeria variabile]
MPPKKSPSLPKSASKSTRAKSKAAMRSEDRFAGVPGRFPNYPGDYSCVRSTKDWAEDKESEKARKDKVVKEKLGAMIRMFERDAQEGKGG